MALFEVNLDRKQIPQRNTLDLKKKKKKKKCLAGDLPSCGLLLTMMWLLTCAPRGRLCSKREESGNFGSFGYK